MKKLIQIVVVAALVLGVFALPGGYRFVFAQAGGSFASSIQVQNLGTADALISIFYYNQDGTPATMASGLANPVTDTVKVGQSNTYYPVHAAAGFNGSVVISSGQPIAAVSNLVVNTAAQGVDSYVGVSSGGTTIYYPLVMKGNASQTTMLNIQNTNSSGDAVVTLVFTPEVGSTYATIANKTLTIKPGAAQTYDLGSAAEFSGVTKWVGSVTATAAGSSTIAGVSTTVNVKYATANQLNTYNAFSSGSTSVVLPLIQENNSGNRTSVNCQNIGAATTTITVKYTPEAGSVNKPDDSKANVPQNGMAVFLQDYTGTAKFVGSAKVSSSPASNLVCVVNQQKPAFGRASSYTGFQPSVATGKVVLPLIQSKNGKSTTGWVYTSINLATADGASHPITCVFNPAPGISTPSSVSGSGASVIFVQNNVFGDGTKFLGGATCTITDSSGAGLFAIVNMTREATPQNPRDVLASYDGFNLP